ncbi:carboxymuconolactone decarboxylase family protein [Jiangella asiatica]|uniref:Carboxymuconolactone decarboxylase family protein n=1 Tax=Jiangella asiatica TaxID=2530372 RepID=A0A4R5DEA8_9ACTN|nr:carboxymuconolactone decarboxylase family protein [Jiangella asiatica]TDE11417.1 carboxymuconolactone decarboxylase family protein [Jiangella asiatica]
MDTAVEPTAVRDRLDVEALAPAAYKALVALDSRSGQGPLPSTLLDLVKLRASQINGCAYCVDCHSRDAVDGAESAARVHAVAVWDEGPFFSPAERAAFALTESMTRLSEGAPRVPDGVWAVAREHFGDEELAQLIMVITTINAWNRVCVTVRMVPESYS